MLDSQAWNRLIQGLVRATDEGTIVWKEAKYAAGYGGVTALRKSALSPLIDQRVLRASSKSVTYELTADSFGRAPYELAVWEEVNDRKTPMGLTGFLAIDPLLGMVFGVVLLWASWTIIRSALRILLQGTPEHLDLPAAIASWRRSTRLRTSTTCTPGPSPQGAPSSPRTCTWPTRPSMRPSWNRRPICSPTGSTSTSPRCRSSAPARPRPPRASTSPDPPERGTDPGI